MAADVPSILKAGLSKHFHYESFRSELQQKAVRAVYEGQKDVFVSMPTGAGKSLCYQLPAVMSPGITLVLSPLIALIEDQVTQLQARGHCVASLNSKTLVSEKKRIYADMKLKKPSTKLLYITPEMAATPGFRETMTTLYKYKKLNLFAIDESHCISEWGHDFRPDYRRLGELRDLFPDVPVVALTATATPTVQDDIFKGLKMKEPVAIFKSSCFRENLYYDVRYKESLKDPIKDLKDFITKGLSGSAKGGAGIIYCRTREGCQELAGRLSSSGIAAKAYHAGLKSDDRSAVQSQWMSGLVPVIVATISFGMGVDKANVRFVVHWTLPKGIEAYYQESGRAGRDGNQSYCRLYYSTYDKNTLLFLLQKEASTASAKGKKKDSFKIRKKESILESFECLVQYCEDLQCRHYSIAKYFGDPKPKCNAFCDVCKNPAALKEALRAHKLCLPSASKKKAPKGSSMALFEYGEADPSLYEGGRWGNRECSSSEGSDNGDSSDDSDGGEGSTPSGPSSTSFIQAQLKKRRKKGKNSTNPELNQTNGDSRVVDVNSTTKIPRLTVKVREYCLEMLLKSLKRNSVSVRTDEVAVLLEHGVFKNAKTTEVYKLQINKLVSEINTASREGRVHSSIGTEWDTKPMEGDPPIDDDAKTTPSSSGHQTGFVMASELPRPKKRIAHSTKPAFTTAPHPPSSGPMSGHYEGFCTASSLLLPKPSEPFHSSEPILPPLLHNHTGDGVNKDSLNNVIHTTDETPTAATNVSCGTVSSNNTATSCIPIVVLDSPSPDRDDDTDDHHATPPTSSSDQRLVDLTKAVLSSRKRNITTGDTPPSKKVATDNVILTSSSSCSSSSDYGSSSKVGMHESLFPNSLIAQKNATVALDDHLLTTTSLTGDSKKTRVASIVVKVLNPHYKKGKIVSKELFKKFAKTLSDHIYKQKISERKVEQFCKSVIAEYFCVVHKVSHDKDFKRLQEILRKQT